MPAIPPEIRKSRFKVDWWLVAVLAVPVIYFLPELLGLNVFAGIDSSRLNEPFRFFDREAFLAGHLPLWNPYYFAGFPHLAESESGLFYPGNIFIHMPGDFFHWYSVEVVAHFMIAGAGFYLWMRMRGHEKLTSAFLAATYETTPFLIFHMTTLGLFTSIVWLPWYFLIFDSGITGKHPVRSGLWMALLLGFMLMSGSVQAAFLGCFGLFIYAICVILVQPDRKSRVNTTLRVLAVLVPTVIAPLIAAIQVLPTMELTRFSERAATDMIEFYNMGTWLNVPRLISLVVFPALDNPADIQSYGSSLCFLGVIPFLFAISSLAFWKTKKQVLVPLIVTGVITLLLAFGRNLPGYDTLVEFPPFSMFRSTLTVYSFLVFTLIAQVFSTYPFSRLLVQKRANFDQSLQFFDDVKAEFPNSDEIPRVLLPGSQFLMDPNAMDHLGFTAPEKVWDNMTGNASGLRNVTSLNGLTPLNQNDWKLVLRDTLQQHIDNIAAQATASGEPKTPDAMSLKIIYMLGTDVLLLEGNDWDVPGFELWREDIAFPFHEGLCAYRFKGGNLPDAYFSSIIFYDFYSDYGGYYRWLSDEYMVIRENVGVEKDGAEGTEMVAYGDANAQITDRDRGYNWMTFDVSVGEGGGFLVTGENYYPGWKALIDGEETEIYKCDYLLMGINVPPGDHEIEFRYQPQSVLVGMIGSISGFVIWIILMLVVTWIHKKGKPTLVLSAE
ncbi:MAG: YfhO family protein [bacterium]|nr:YfhO family protein [bacterium]